MFENGRLISLCQQPNTRVTQLPNPPPDGMFCETFELFAMIASRVCIAFSLSEVPSIVFTKLTRRKSADRATLDGNILFWSAVTCHRYGRCDLSQPFCKNLLEERGVKPPRRKAVTGHRTPKKRGALFNEAAPSGRQDSNLSLLCTRMLHLSSGSGSVTTF